MSSNDWLDSPAAKRLIKLGLMDGDTGATRKARAVRCEQCHRGVMRGFNGNFGYYVDDADPEPLSRLGEALALLAGRRTVSLSWTGDHYEIDTRDQFRIRGSPAGTVPGSDILVIHDCKLAVGQPLPHMNSMLADVAESAPLSEEPPF